MISQLSAQSPLHIAEEKGFQCHEFMKPKWSHIQGRSNQYGIAIILLEALHLTSL